MKYSDEQGKGEADGEESEPTLRRPAVDKARIGAVEVVAVGMLAPGTRLHNYEIARKVRASSDEAVYVARVIAPPVAPPEGPSEEAPAAPEAEAEAPPEESADAAAAAPLYVTLIERPVGGFTHGARIVSLGLRHPRILIPWSIVAEAGHEYLVTESLTDDSADPARTVAAGARLEPTAALTAVAGLADALGYLHRNGIAHLHISPEVLVVQHGRAYLAGMETAEYVGTAPAESRELFARDANFLARSLGVLVAPPGTAAPDESAGAREVLQQIVERGVAGHFTAPEEVAGACVAGLQVAPVLPGATESLGHGRITVDIGTASNVGRVRSENQDACAAAVLDIRDDVGTSLPVGVFLVADGMGGEARGELASRIAARMVVSEIVKHFALPVITLPALQAVEEEGATSPIGAPEARVGRALCRAVDAANRQIRVLARQLGQTTGTTMTAVAICGARAGLAHVGDSRAYLMRSGSLVQLTEDHSVLARLQAIDHPLLSDPDIFVPRSMLYRSLGQEDETNVDTLDFTLSDGDRLLLCSDGLWDEVEPAALDETLAQAEDPRACAEQLIALANESGGHDNSTAVVVFVRAVPEDTSRADTGAAEQPAERAATAEGTASSAGDEPARASEGAEGTVADVVVDDVDVEPEE